MNVIFILICISLLVAGGFLAAFIWAVKAGQFDDSYTPSVRILFEDNSKKINHHNSSHANRRSFKRQREKGSEQP